MPGQHEQQRRLPQMPPGSSTLAERIAALQRQASTDHRRSSSERSSASRSASGSSGVEAGSPSSSMRATGAPNRDIWTNGSNTSSSSSSSVGGSSSRNPPPQAVRDRIARFQQSSENGIEKPLVPRSSFGLPAPNPQNTSRVLRPYPGASGSGSGNWGENVLRPQMTGSAWTGTGSSGSTGRAQGLMPQMTGPTWSRRQASSPEPTRREPVRTISGRDAFQDLDGDFAGLSTSPGASEGASRGENGVVNSHSPTDSRRGSVTPSAAGSPAPAPEAAPSSSLPVLPDTPTTEIEAQHGQLGAGTGEDRGPVSGEDNPNAELLPSPPTEIPRSPRQGRTNSTADTSIEVGVSGASASQLEQLRAAAAAAEADPEVPTEAVEDAVDLSDIPTPPSGALLRSASSSAQAETQLEEVEEDTNKAQDNAFDASTANGDGRSHESTQIESTVPSSSAQPATVDPSLSSSQTARSPSPSPSPAGLVMPQEPVEPPNPNASSSSPVLIEVSGPMPSNSDLQQNANQAAAAETADLQLPPSLGSNTSGDASIVTGNGIASMASTGSNVTTSSNSSETSAMAASTPQRSPMANSRKSSSMRRPPPGRFMSVAELDASDDEYEPGWASVISSSRG